MASFKHDPDGQRLPIKVDNASNGEFEPLALPKRCAVANEQAMRDADDASRHIGTSRRSFLVSSAGAASTLLSMNAVNAAAGNIGGFFDIPRDARHDTALADHHIGGDEFIFDVHGHFINPHGAWRQALPEGARPFLGLPAAQACDATGEGLDYLECLSGEQFVKDVFIDSDTDMMVLTFVPSPPDAEPLTIEEAEVTKKLLNDDLSSPRLLVHGRVNPNQDGDLDSMDELAERWKISAWKTYTQWGPEGKGFWLHDEDTGIPFLEKARALGVNNIAVHKGIPFGRQSYEHSRCDDIGIVAKRYPDLNFLVYHSGYVPGQKEVAFMPGEGKDGIDALVQSLIDNDVPPNSNVYADLGSTWRMWMQDPDAAAHGMGKLFKYVGEDNVIWGTDSIWYGSPQDQIQAFRAFQISEQLRETYDYPELTPALRAKVFGLNAAKPYAIDVPSQRLALRRDALARTKAELMEQRDPHYLTFGPKNRREFVAFRQADGHTIA